MTFTRETPKSIPDRFLRGTWRIGSTCTAALFGLLLGLSQTPAAAQDRAYEVVQFEGTVVPAREADITPIVSGWLRHIAFVPGQIVDEGDVLFEFAMPPAQYRLDLAKAQQDAAQAQLQEAIAEVKRAELLKDRDVVSEVELEKTIALRDIAAANLAAAEANVGLAGLGVMQMTQKAPFAGMMSAPMVRENGWQDVGDGDITMAIITQLDPIQVVGEVPYDVYAARQKMFGSDQELIDGIALSLILPGGEVYPHEGRLVSGGYKFEAESQKMTVWVEFPNPELLLRPGLKVAIQSRVKP
ncbi:efflux RND transporter periplasmic adaptor subunit [Alloyangia pacifica]|uniref:Membrane fusion protein, multidrug efflux system n=1 Tax=Alloyangia pacifica TaxID=311180 RepID=A0A1I6RU31_9RHOB|nr:efflux RND transporter periplasmic adaptor subunit [Alloyangia pacifica]SDG61003.1 membrane fusion protein, multidrug efflux system [Alloyangia pacifica]SFS68221.1 membrane fusion protein, multidrug efflux system [Alloyangia pacifica]